jgi:hypothetical protein
MFQMFGQALDFIKSKALTVLTLMHMYKSVMTLPVAGFDELPVGKDMLKKKQYKRSRIIFMRL